jgi:hypothetical protein
VLERCLKRRQSSPLVVSMEALRYDTALKRVAIGQLGDCSQVRVPRPDKRVGAVAPNKRLRVARTNDGPERKFAMMTGDTRNDLPHVAVPEAAW